MKDRGPNPQWLKPKVKRLNAGSAEFGSTNSTDVGVSFS